MNKQHIYFVGAGGIGMANLVRYFLSNGYRVAGYDLTCTELTTALEKEGAIITYEDKANNIPSEFRNTSKHLLSILLLFRILTIY